MAIIYYDYNNGNNADDGSTPALAKADRGNAVLVSAAGDSVVAVDGVHAHQSSFFAFNDDRVEGVETFRGSTLQANAGEVVRVARTDSGLSSANNPKIIDGFVFDGESGNAGAGVQYAFDLGNDAAQDLVIHLHNCHFISGTIYGLLNSLTRGRMEIVNGLITGVFANRYIVGVNLSSNGNGVVDIKGLEIIPDAPLVGKLVEFRQEAAPTNTLDIFLSGFKGTFDIPATSGITLMDLQCKDTIVISDANVTLNADDTSLTVTGLLVQGLGVGFELTRGEILNSIVRNFCPAGTGIGLGQTSTPSYISDGIIAGCTCIGKYYPAPATPHNFGIGKGVTGELRGNISTDTYVGYVLTCDSVNGSGNLAFDCYGPSYFIEGATFALMKRNVAVVSSKYPQRGRGILTVAPLAAVNTQNGTFEENLIIVEDATQIHSLGYIEDINQICFYTRNTYIIPDTVDVTSALLFSYKNGQGGAANNTLAQWNAQSEVTDDVIVQMPIEKIREEISKYRDIVKPKPDIMYIKGQGARLMNRDKVI